MLPRHFIIDPPRFHEKKRSLQNVNTEYINQPRVHVQIAPNPKRLWNKDLAPERFIFGRKNKWSWDFARLHASQSILHIPWAWDVIFNSWDKAMTGTLDMSRDRVLKMLSVENVENLGKMLVIQKMCWWFPSKMNDQILKTTAGLSDVELQP